MRGAVVVFLLALARTATAAPDSVCGERFDPGVTYLQCSEHPDPAMLAKLTHLRTLELSPSDHGWVDLSPLAGLHELTRLHVQGGLFDPTQLAGASELADLELVDDDLTTLEPLRKLGKLVQLDVTHNPIVDLAPLSQLRALHLLNLSRDESIEDLRPLAKLVELRELYVDDTGITSIDGLAGLPRLDTLDLRDTAVTTLAPLASISSLASLALGGARVADLDFTPIGKLVHLERLFAAGSQLADLRPLRSLAALELLDIRDTRVRDLTPLAKLPALTRLAVRGSRVSAAEVARLKHARKDLATDL